MVVGVWVTGYGPRVITTLRITGMTCNNCVRHVDKALRAVSGVSAVDVSLPDKTAKVSHDDTATVPSLIAAIESAGYEAAV
jgi:copper ion binding protein